MNCYRGQGESISTFIIAIMIGLITPGILYAGPVGLPDSARPGAVRPEQEDKLEIPKPPPETVMDVPPVIDRPFDVDECPCTVVSKFRLLNAEDMPEYDVNLADVQSILDKNIKEQADEGFSIGQLQEVANKVRNYYRQKGLILTQVVVPVQTVENGVVDLELYVGKLGRVLAEGNKMYSKEKLEQVFDDLIGKPIYKADIEAALLRLTDFPGLTVFGVFQPGQLVGTADIVLKVQKEKRFDVAFRVDNHGTRETGQNRFRTIIDWNNITNGDDKLSLTVQQTYHPKNNDFKGFDYERYLSDGSYLAKAFFNTNRFDVGGTFKANQIRSETNNAGLSLQKSFIRSRVLNLSAELGFTKKQSYTRTKGIQTNIDRLSVFDLGINYDSVDTFNPFSFLSNEKEGGAGGGINFATLELSRGVENLFGSMGSSAEMSLLPQSLQSSRRSGVNNLPAPGKFNKVFASFTRLQTVKSGVSLLIRSEWQWTDDILAPIEQYSVGGPDNVRAFPVAQVLWDKAFFASFEFLFNAPFIADKPAFENRTWGELLQLGIFYDMAVGKVNEPSVADEQGYRSHDGVGVGLRFNLPGTIESRIFSAWEIGNNTLGNNRRPQIWGDLTYTF